MNLLFPENTDRSCFESVPSSQLELAPVLCEGVLGSGLVVLEGGEVRLGGGHEVDLQLT